MPAPEKIRVVLVDDEAPARSLLREYLTAYPDIEVVAECANGFDAVKRVGETKPNLMFLDIQMPKLDGFEVLELLDPAPVVIFCTAYDEYALRAFQVHAVDYLLKPFGRDRFAEALGRARGRLGVEAGGVAVGGAPAPAAPGDQARALAAAARGEGQYLERIVVRQGSAVHVVPVEALDLVEAQDDYIGVHAGGKVYLKAQRLADLEESLDPSRFVRVHRSYIVPLDRIVRLEPFTKDSRVAVLKSGVQVPVSRSGYARLQELM